MKTVCSFFAKFASVISWVLSCFDRVIFKGHLPISRAYEFENFVDYRLKMRRADFLKILAPKWSERLVEHAKHFAAKYGRVWEYCAGTSTRTLGPRSNYESNLSLRDWSASCA